MNKLIKNKKIIFLILVFSFLIPYSLFLIPTPAQAQVKLETGLPGHSTVPTETALPSYISYLFIFGLSLITILALTQMIIGGITYILAAGNAAKVEDAKDMIFQALLGVGLLLVSYLLLRTINPDLVNLRNPTLIPTSFIPAPTPVPTGPEVPPQPGLPSELIYNVTSPQACADAGGQAFSPCQTYCLATPGLCGASNVCCGTKP